MERVAWREKLGKRAISNTLDVMDSKGATTAVIRGFRVGRHKEDGRGGQPGEVSHYEVIFAVREEDDITLWKFRAAPKAFRGRMRRSCGGLAADAPR